MPKALSLLLPLHSCKFVFVNDEVDPDSHRLEVLTFPLSMPLPITRATNCSIDLQNCKCHLYCGAVY